MDDKSIDNLELTYTQKRVALQIWGNDRTTREAAKFLGMCQTRVRQHEVAIRKAYPTLPTLKEMWRMRCRRKRVALHGV